MRIYWNSGIFIYLFIRVFDADGNGLIDREELQKVMKSLNEELSEDELNAMIREADVCCYFIYYKLSSGKIHPKEN